MKNNSHPLPDPLLPEHQLIRQAVPAIQLSPGFKQRLMTDVRHQVRLSRWKFRAQVSAAVLAACAILLLVCFPGVRPFSAASTDHDSAISSPDSPGSSRQSYPAEPGNSVVEQPSPINTVPPSRSPRRLPETRDTEQLHHLMEQLQERQNKLCGLLPLL